MKKLNKKWIIAITAAAVLTVSCVAVAAASYQAGTPQEVSEQQAKQIAFEHAGVGEGDVSALEIHRDLENGREVYSVEFHANGKEYEYDVRISDGEIVQSSQESIGRQESQTQPVTQTAQQSTEPVAQPTEASGSGTAAPAKEQGAVTADEARAIALQHAGVAESDLRFIQVKEDYEDGVAVYKVEFYAGNQEYDYDIVKATGEILKYDYDVDHFTPDNSVSSDQVKISLSEARQLALAKVSGASESDLYLELDWDDGRPVYEGEIHYGGMEYEFEIDASTGTFLEWSMDHR
ncbi:MAG: PepSY domain-containing protein [Clostridia bacterium]